MLSPVGGALSQGTMSSGDASAVSMQRRQRCRLSTGIGGNSKFNGSQ
jgi:hypothetical protein